MTIGRIKKHPGASKIAIVPLIIRSGEAPQLHAEVAERRTNGCFGEARSAIRVAGLGR